MELMNLGHGLLTSYFEPWYQDAKHGILFKMCVLGRFYHDTSC
jgi:hypothetical protein